MKNSKKSLKDLFSTFEVSIVDSKYVTGGRVVASGRAISSGATLCGTCEKETAGSSLSTWVDTPSDCGVDPDQCDPDCI